MPVVHYLLALITKKRSPAYVLVGKDGVVIGMGGALPTYGLQRARAGERLGEELYFLEGLLPLEGEAVVLPRVKVRPGVAADIHIFAGVEGDYVLLLDATLDESRERQQQQNTNELGLLRRKLAKLSNP